jgi:uncharacterized protein YyaL (SSP411 family)
VKNGKFTNRLASSLSPYLKQHAHNPVDWHEWGEEAFDLAKSLEKPIFLSIGYSTCHWCHVMERESFEDVEVAKILNEHFVSIKVDREERPDIDNIYMAVCQMVGQNCGWPLTVIMTPQKEPFYIATYIPKNDAYGRPGMMTLLPAVTDAWKNRKEEIKRSVDSILDGLKKYSNPVLEGTLTLEDCHVGKRQLESSFDEEFGGFGSKPKFPTPHNLLFLSRYAALFKDAGSIRMVEKTLTAMARGGLFDQVGYGFHRYSTDQRWFLPHFEKMLYDQAMLLQAYTEGWQLTGNDELLSTAGKIVEYCSRDLAHEDGGFFSAEDADSEGEEGKFYVWSEEELKRHLTAEEFNLAKLAYGTTEEGTYREEATGETTGNNILFIARGASELHRETGIPVADIEQRLEEIRIRLFAVREKRIRPGLDDKILTDWNGLYLASLARYAWVADNDAALNQAISLADFLLVTMVNADGTVLHRFKDGEAGIAGFLDDYIFISKGLISTFGATGESKYLARAIEIMNKAVDQFWDDQNGGFYFTSTSAEKLLIRKKEVYDGAIPSANSVAIEVLLNLFRLTADDKWSELAVEITNAFAGKVREHPAAYTQFMSGVLASYRSSNEVIVVAENREELKPFEDLVRTEYLPTSFTLFLSDEQNADYAKLYPGAAEYKALDGKATAYICQNFSCQLPVVTLQEFGQKLKTG